MFGFLKLFSSRKLLLSTKKQAGKTPKNTQKYLDIGLNILYTLLRVLKECK